MPSGSGFDRERRQSAVDDLYRLLVETVRDYAIFALDPEGRIVTWNNGAQRIKGYAASEIIGRHFSVFYPPEDVAADKPGWELREATAVGQVEDEGWRVRKDGTRFWANVLITALRDEDGTLVGFAKVTRDLTERRAAEERLRRSEERFRLLVSSVRDYGIFMLDPDGYVASWNEGADRINGYEAEEIIGRHVSVFYPPEDVAAGRPGIELRTALETGRFEEEAWRVRKDGSRFWANIVV
jgi:PAS domain S-box-containing protein